MHTMSLISIKNLYDMEARDFIKWLDYLNEKNVISVCYDNHIVDERTNNISFELRKFEIDITADYITFTAKNHPSEYYTIYSMDFTEIIFK